MYQINKRFFIAITIIEVACMIAWIFCSIGFPVWAAALITLFLNASFFILFFVTLDAISKDDAELERKIQEHGVENTVRISREDAKKFRKEGALYIDGKSYINKDFELWKRNGNQMKEHQIQ